MTKYRLLKNIAQAKEFFIHIVRCRFYWAIMFIQMPILMQEDALVEILYTKLYLCVMGCSIMIYYFNRHNGT